MATMQEVPFINTCSQPVNKKGPSPSRKGRPTGRRLATPTDISVYRKTSPSNPVPRTVLDGLWDFAALEALSQTSP